MPLVPATREPECLPELEALRQYTGVRKVLVLSEDRGGGRQNLGCSSSTSEDARDFASLCYLQVPQAGCTFVFAAEDLKQTVEGVDGSHDAKLARLIARATGRIVLGEDSTFIYDLGDAKTPCLVLSSPRSLDVLARAEAIADSPRPVLVVGETGVGKELISRYIHRVSGREKFVGISMAQVRGESAVSELFGHVKGAFTGAASRRLGAFLEAGEGTLFLDEISEMSEEAMALLLRAMEQKRVKPLGSDKEVPAPARIIAATNRPEALRKDLYYRFVHRIEMPPLRERKKDISAIARFVGFREGFELTQKALRTLECMSPWDGNVRELEHFLFQAAAAATKHILGVQDILHAFSTSAHLNDSRQDEGNRVRELRTALGLSIRKLADALDMPKSTLEDIEKGKTKGRDREVLAKIGEKLAVLNNASRSKSRVNRHQHLTREIKRFLEEEGAS